LSLPTINAALNATSAAFLAAGFLAIRRGRRELHRLCMLAAATASGLFLIGYLIYHARVGSVPFTGRGTIRIVYFAVLLTHTVLAAAIVPLVLVTLRRALGGRFDAHRRLARLTLPLWAWVSVSGVAIYWMLYRL
jgi:uncharacterized membrane protein YozB (DUF420 family)